MSKQINCSVVGRATDIPTLTIDNGHSYVCAFESQTRAIFTIPDTEPPWGASIAFGGQSLRYVIPAAPGAYEGPVLTYPPLELPRITIAGDQFQLNGQRWVWKMMSGFRDYDRFLHGEDITPQLQQAKDLGANGRRVFFFVHSFGNLNPPDYSRVADFLDLLARYGLYCEMTSGDLQYLPVSQLAHFNALLDIARTKTNVFFEFCNESDNNGLDKNAAQHANRSGVICSLGSSTSGNQCPLPSLDYAGSHIRRDIGGGMYADTCPLEMQTGYTGYPGVGPIPVPHTETIGAAEYVQAGRRTNDPQVFFRLARMASAWNGMTFHSELGIDSQVLSGAQLACAQAFFAGLS